MPTLPGMGDGHAYWDWRDSLLKHPDGRAKGGEPCVKCGNPVPANAHWKQRDRHVCSSRCNMNLGRQLNRLIRKHEDGAEWKGSLLGAPDRLSNPRTSGPRTFRTLPDQEPPYEWEGFGPIPGDLIERYGTLTRYDVWHKADGGPWPEWWPDHVLVAECVQSLTRCLWGADENGVATRLRLGYYSPTGELVTTDTFDADGVQCRWHFELISDTTPDGREFTWEAPVAAPVQSPYKSGHWSPARTALSEARKRTSASTARHARRVRLEAATIETFDPVEVYDRDRWVCQLCEHPVDPDLTWPDPLSHSLDHVIPLSANGEHSRANTQLAHLICNVRKNNTYNPSPE